MYRRKRRILKSLVLGFVVAAFAAPAALAEPRGPGNDPQAAAATPAASPDDRSMYRGTSPQLDPQYVGSPDDRAMYHGTSQIDAMIASSPRFNVVGSTMAVEPPKAGLTLSPAIRGEQVKTIDRPSFGPVSEPTVSVTTDDGFQWVDAGFGAASTLALVLLMGAAGLLIRHQRRRIAAY
jgi:hypothetical protein